MTTTDTQTQTPVRLDIDAHAKRFSRAMSQLDHAATAKLGVSTHAWQPGSYQP